MVREGRAPCSWISMSKRTTGLTFFKHFPKFQTGMWKNCHPCMHCLPQSVGQVNIWDMKMLQLAYRSGHSLSEKEQMFNGSILLYWFTSCNFMKLKFDKRDINFKSAKDVASKTLLFSLEHENNVVVVMVTWFCEASRTHGQCERSLLPSKGAHHCLSCLWQDWWTATNVAFQVVEQIQRTDELIFAQNKRYLIDGPSHWCI